MATLGSIWSLYRPLLAAPWQMQRNASPWSFYLGWGLCVLGYLLALGSTAVFASRSSAHKLVVVQLATVFVFPWITSFAGLLAQNRPHAARLVPSHVTRLRRAAVGMYLLTVGLVAALLASQFPGGQAWLQGTALLLFVLALLARWYRLWLPVTVVLSLAPWWSDFMPIVLMWSALLSWQQSQPFSLSLILLLLLPWGLTRLFQTGGKQHQAQFQAKQKMRRVFEAMSLGQPLSVPLSAPLDRLVGLFRWMQPLWTRHVLRVARPTPSSVMARLDLVTLGPTHWSCQLSSITVVLALLALVFGAIVWSSGVTLSLILKNGAMGLSFGLASACLGVLLSVPANLYRSRREQALLMLLPGVPRGPALNVTLARRLLAQLLWGVGLALLLCVGLEALPGIRSLNWLGVHLCLAYLIEGSFALLRDWSRQSKPNSNGSVLPLLRALALVGVLQGMHWLGVPLLLQLGLALLVFLVQLVWRWQHRVLRTPAAMPVGRWA